MWIPVRTAGVGGAARRKDLLAKTAKLAAEHTEPSDMKKVVRSRQPISRRPRWTTRGHFRGVGSPWTGWRWAPRRLPGGRPSRGHSEDSRAGRRQLPPDRVATGMMAVRGCCADRSSVSRCRSLSKCPGPGCPAQCATAPDALTCRQPGRGRMLGGERRDTGAAGPPGEEGHQAGAPLSAKAAPVFLAVLC